MPRRVSTSSRYFYHKLEQEFVEQRRVDSNRTGSIEPLNDVPDYSSIIWLASKIELGRGPDLSSTAIKGSLLIGQGATFVVTRATYRRETYAIKQPRLAFKYDQDESDVFRQLYALHLELRVLTNQGVRDHDNIAKLIGILWEEHSDDLGRHWPSLIMEYADYGTLAEAYKSGLRLSFLQEQVLCYGIGDALNFLHENGIVHGDIKPENVLMYSGPVPGSITPRLSDFGFSVLDQCNTPTLPGGTPNWEAPEVSENNITSQDLVHSDTYSFGLLVWYIAREGITPFAGLEGLGIDLQSTEARKKIQLLKATSDIPSMASRSVESAKRSYSNVFDLTLVREPTKRALSSALRYLSDENSAKGTKPITTMHIPHQVRDELSLGGFRHLGYQIQIQLTSAFERMTDSKSGYSEQHRSGTAMILAQICMERLGGKVQEQTMEWLELAASLGHFMAKSVIYRVAKALGSYENKKNTVFPYLTESAGAGIAMAIDDLLEVDGYEGELALKKLEQKRRSSLDVSPEASLSDSLDTLSITGTSKDSIFQEAALYGDVPTLQKLLLVDHRDHLMLLNSQNEMGQTPLLLACIAGEFPTAMTLLDAGASAAISDEAGDTPLHWLHSFEHSNKPVIITALLKSGAELHALSGRFAKLQFSQKTVARGSPLHRAAALNDVEAVRLLLDRGADPLIQYNKPGGHELSTPLWLACNFHNDGVVNAILLHLSKSGVDVASILNDGERQEWPFLKAVLDMDYHYLNGGMLGRILRHGSLYHKATENTIRALKEHGAKMNLNEVTQQSGITGLPALHCAIILRCIDIVQVVLELSPESIEQWDRKFKQPPLHTAAQLDLTDIVELLIRNGANVRSRNNDGITALGRHANCQPRLEVPKLLLGHGLQYEIPSNGYQTPFFGAVVRGSFELAAFVLEHTPAEDRGSMINAPCTNGANFSHQGSGITVLGFLLSVCHRSLTRVVRRLFDLVEKYSESVDFVVEPGRKWTALHVLADLQQGARTDSVVAAVAKELMDRFAVKGDELDAVSEDGRSALFYAVINLNYDLVDCLLDAGASPHIADRRGWSPLRLLRGQAARASELSAGSRAKETVETLVRLFQGYGYSLSADGQETAGST